MERKNIKQIAFDLLEPFSENNLHGRWFDWLLSLLILLNVVAVMLETLPAYGREYGQLFLWFEVFSVVVFTLEYAARIWTCTLNDEQAAQSAPMTFRLKYMLRPMSIVDLLAILPFYLSIFFALDLRILRVFRLLRIIKLGRYSSAMQILYRVISKEYKVIVAALGMLLSMMIVAAMGMYYLERVAQPEYFGSIPQALWWSLITLSTVGYGDVVPITAAGKVFAGLFVLMGVALFALPAGIIASGFTEQMAIRRETFSATVKDMLADGHLTADEVHKLELIRKTLGLDRKEAEALFDLARNKSAFKQHAPSYCPHCGKSLAGEESSIGRK